MANNYGVILSTSPSTFSWHLGIGRFPDKCSSGKMSVCLNKYKVWFQLNRIDETFSDLNLCMSKKVKLKLNLHISLTYRNETKDFSVEFRTIHYDAYKLAKVKAIDLLVITCSFLSVQETVESCRVMSGEIVNNDEEKAGSSQITQNNANINSEIKEPIKSKGLIGLSENFKDAFLSEEDSDVILKVGDQNYPAHKVIIKSRSSVFKAMLKHDMKERNEGVINIPDCDPNIFRDFLLYLYTGALDDISKENVFELYQTSDKYNVKDLKLECVDFISKNLSVDMICDIISLATRHCEQALLARAIEYFTDHAQDILPSVNWQNFVKEYPVEANELFLKTFQKLSGK